MGKQYQKEIEQILQGAESKTPLKQVGGTTRGNPSKELSKFIASKRLLKLFLFASLGLLLISFISSTFLPSLIVKILVVIATITFLFSYGGLLITINTKPNK